MTYDGRYLAAIMFTDMVGFTAMMQTDEATGRAKRARYVEAMERHHQVHGGTISQWFGDGALSTFPSAVGAVRAAIAMQGELRADDPVDVRLGLHLGDLFVEEVGILGDAVNIASRIESFSVPGAVVVSDTVHDQVKNQADLGFVDLGTYRLKNVGRPFRLFAVDDASVVVPLPGELRGKGGTALVLPDSLPRGRPQLVGRDREVAELSGLIDGHRLLTVTGPGGAGKTSLALAVADAVRSRFAAVAFVPLAPISDPAAVVPAIAKALDTKEAEGRSAVEAISDLLADHAVLMVVDNFEQVSSAAPAVSDLLGRCPGLRVLVTSRGPLHLRDEEVFALDTLSTPDEDRFGSAVESDAVALFVEAGRRARPGFELTEDNAADVAAICRQLDGLPLALELAASRLRLLTPEALGSRLNDGLGLLSGGRADAGERHSTLRATIEWSHGLLNDEAKALFRRLAVFPDGATIEGIEAVTAGGGPLPIDELEALVDLALVRLAGDRFSMLQTIRQFAAERLDESGEREEVTVRHVRHQLEVARSVYTGLEGGDQVGAIERGRAEDAGFGAALDVCLEAATAGDAELGEVGMELSGYLWNYWHFRGKHLTTRHYTSGLLEATEDRPTPGRCGALLALGLAEWTLGHIEDGTATWQRCHDLALELGIHTVAARAAFGVGVGYLGSDLERALEWTTTSCELSEKTGDEWAYAFSLGFKAFVVALLGDPGEAKSLFEEALAIQQRIGDYEGGGFALGGLAFLRAQAGDLQGAAELYEQARASYATIGDRAEEARILVEMAWVHHAAGSLDAARAGFLDGADAYRDVASVRGIGGALVGLAATDSAAELHERAVTIAAAAEVFAAGEGIVNAYAESPGAEELLAGSAEALGADRASSAKRHGRSLPVEAALRLGGRPQE